MHSTSESATRPNKRSRTNDGAISRRTTRRSPDGQAAGPVIIYRSTNATINDPHQLVGSRLEPIIEDLASQPKSLQTTLIEIQHSMLDKLATIKQRMKSSLRFTKPVIDPKTGKESTDEDGAPKTFVPNSCRSKCPVEASSSFKDDPRMVAKLEAAHKDHEAWKTTMSNHAKEVSWLEIEMRVEELREELFDYVTKVARTWFIMYNGKGLVPTSTLSRDEWGHTIAYGIICSFDDTCAEFFHFYSDKSNDVGPTSQDAEMSTDDDRAGDEVSLSGSMKFGNCYLKTTNFDLEAAKKKSDNREGDKATITEILSKTACFVHDTTIKFWNVLSDLELEKEIDAEIKRDLVPKSITAATEAAAHVLDKIDLANPPKPLDDYIDKRIKAGQTKLRRELKNAQRLNCSGDARNQESTPTANGTSSKKVRFKSSNSTTAPLKKGKKKKNGGKKTTPPSQDPKAATPKGTSNQKKAKSGSQGGPKKGGRQSGAARR